MKAKEVVDFFQDSKVRHCLNFLNVTFSLKKHKKVLIWRGQIRETYRTKTKKKKTKKSLTKNLCDFMTQVFTGIQGPCDYLGPFENFRGNVFSVEKFLES